MIRLLLDQGLPRSTAAILRAAGWDVVHIGEINMSKAADAEILDYAERKDRICITLDADFHAILAVSDARGPSVVRFRYEGLRGNELADHLQAIWPSIDEHATRGAMITVTKSTVRIRRLPVSEDRDINDS